MNNLLSAILRVFTALLWPVRFLSKRYSHYEESSICSNDVDIVDGGTGPVTDDLSGWHELPGNGSGLLGVVQHREGIQEDRSALLAVIVAGPAGRTWRARKRREKGL